MDAVIIAAGYGSRLASLSPSKPLTPVAGVPLIEIAARQCKAAGVTRIVVVTGHEADAVEQFLEQCAIRVGLPIEAVRIDDWSRPNGWSVIAGAAACTGPFLLLMADHMFDAAILARLAGEGGPDRDVTLAIHWSIRMMRHGCKPSLLAGSPRSAKPSRSSMRSTAAHSWRLKPLPKPSTWPSQPESRAA
jgi:CTP:molybdopterin cytidylyltransferase MocA